MYLIKNGLNKSIMEIYKTLRVMIFFTALFMFSSFLYSQDDISVKFSFKKPNEFVCEIKNMTEYQITILLSRESAEEHSDLSFDIVGSRNDTTKHVSYLLMKDVNDQSQVLRLDSGQVYKTSYKEYFSERFIRAYIYIKYGVKSLKPRIVDHYQKNFNLIEIREADSFCK